MSGYRLPGAAGAWIDRSRTLAFEFDGRRRQGHPGDTLASALLASGTVHVGRSFKLHRPRGIFSGGVEEPTGLVDIGDGARRTPNTRATDIALTDGLVARPGNAWPSLRWDIGALGARFAGLLPAGFYYKTFMWPGWRWFEPAIRRAAGLGHAAGADTGADPDRYDELSVHVHTLVVGGGVAGLEAAIRAARAGHEVMLMEGQPRLGGWAAAQGEAGRARVAALALEAATAGVRVHTGCTVFGLYDHHLAAAVQTLDDGSPPAAGMPRERLWKIRAQHIVVACGAFERPMLFPDNDRPGVMLASAVQRCAELYGVACGRRVLLAAACDSAYGVARSLQAAGIEVAAIVDHRAAAGVEPPPGLPVHRASAIVAVRGGRAVTGATVISHDGGTRHEIEADCIAVAGGWTPAVNLYSMAGGRLRWDERSSMFVPALALPGIEAVGACAGEIDAGEVPADNRPSAAALSALGRRPGKVFVDLQNDVAASDVALAARENFRSVEHLKRYTTLGMATDQGKTSNVNAIVLMGGHTQRTPPQVGTTKFRPPFKPVTINAIAAGRSGERIKPLRRMPGHDWHVARQGLFEDFGGWLRPAAYPQGGESLEQAAQREALQVRQAVGLFEGSPLGKIEVFGPDAADFLDLMVVGTMSTLPVGGARYGILVNENGVVFDDGIVARLAPDRFWVNTTSGGAERVALAFEEWLQCEYVNHRVLVTPVTSAWGNVTVSGPRAWQLLEAAGLDPALAPAAMKHMTLRETLHAGTPMRVLRASFNGELGYEINLPATATPALLDRLWSLGQDLGAVPYGIEALMVMRTEKGYLHVGGDTDGTTLPGDIGMDRGIAKKAANFVGRRSLLRPAALDPDRMQLVGLLPVDRRTRLPVGAHAVAPPGPPGPIEGFVTSSHHSPNLGYPVALAMLQRGRSRLGERITVHHLGTAIAAEVVTTPFLDPQGDRLHGRA
jgi:sarcosine oxidase subunit alpha